MNPNKRPNILIICADQLSWRALPMAGNANYRVPNIERITSRGALFEQCYTAIPLCLPARAALWTGCFPHQTGVLSNGRRHEVPPIPDDLPRLGELFVGAGYRAVHFGKQHDGGGLRGFEREPNLELPVESPAAYPVTYDTKQDRYTTTKVVEFLENHGDQSWIAVADLNNPHNICDWIGANQGTRQSGTAESPLPPLPSNFRDADDEFARRPLPVRYLCCTHNRLAQTAGWDEHQYRRYLEAYGHYLRRVDDEIGLILDALEARADGQNTLIVLMADHGEGLAAHGLVTKQVSFCEEITRVPFCFAGPSVVPAQQNAPLTSLLDLLPTLCDYAQIEAPAGWGRSLVPWMRGESDEASPHAYIAAEWLTEWGDTIEPGRMIRTPRFKYNRYLESDGDIWGEELYDLHDDPGETRSIVDAPEFAEVTAEHRRLLQMHIEATGDNFWDLQPQTAERPQHHAPGYHNHSGPTAAMAAVARLKQAAAL